MLPTVLVGSISGVLINMMLPALVLQIILTLLLLFLAIQSGFKAKSIFDKESAKLAAAEKV